MLISPHTPKLYNMENSQENSQELDKKYLLSPTRHFHDKKTQTTSFVWETPIFGDQILM